MLARMASLALCVLTFALVVLGGVVHATGASLACPDWPTCHGSLAPAMVGGVRFEHSHRLLAGLVVLVTLGLLFLAPWKSVRGVAGRRVRQAAFAAFGLVVLQASLGAATVLLRLPPAISVAHLAVAMSFFVVSIWLAWLLHPTRVELDSNALPRRRAILFAFACVAAQVLLGALVRHTASGLACPSFPDCDGAGGWLDARQWLQVLHRGGALLVTASIGWLAFRSVRGSVRESLTEDLPLVLAALALTGVQVVLGAWSVVSTLAAWAVTLHLAVGALLLAVLWLAWLFLSARDAEAAE